jgi:hypothetical protein
MDSNENKQHVGLCKSSGQPRGILASNWQNMRAMNEARPQSKCSRAVHDDRVFHSALPPMPVVSARPCRAHGTMAVVSLGTARLAGETLIRSWKASKDSSVLLVRKIFPEINNGRLRPLSQNRSAGQGRGSSNSAHQCK